jgi:hypothetical protein
MGQFDAQNYPGRRCSLPIPAKGTSPSGCTDPDCIIIWGREGLRRCGQRDRDRAPALAARSGCATGGSGRCANHGAVLSPGSEVGNYSDAIPIVVNA